MPKEPHHLVRNLPPTVLTIFGATGDLSADYLIPALLHMEKHKLLPRDFRLVAVGRRELDSKKYLDFILKKSEAIKGLKLSDKKRFLKHLIYYRGDFENPESFKGLGKILADQDRPKHSCYNRLFYFATNPQAFSQITRIL